MADELKLHGAWFSPYVKRVQMVLKMKGVEEGVKYEYIEEDLRNKSSLLQKINPINKKVPVFIHNGNPIVESLIIIEYIDEAFPGPSILPKEPYERSKARFWAKFLDEKATVSLFSACMKKGNEREKAEEEAIEALKILENEIKGKKFFGGDNIGLVDITASSLAYWFPIIEQVSGVKLLTIDKYPNLCKWSDEYSNDAFARKYFPPEDQLFTFFKAGFEAGRLY